MDGTRVWRGQGYGEDMGMEVTWIWKGHGYGGDKGMERI